MVKLTTADFIERARKVHGDTYIYNDTVYNGATKNVTIECRIHGLFQKRASRHLISENRNLKGEGCRACGGNGRSNTNEFVQKSTIKHGDGRYDYSKVDYKRSDIKVTIICRRHEEPQEFEQPPGNHLYGFGCKECTGTAPLDTNKFIKKATKKHGDRYDYSKVDYVKSNLPVIIICRDHGEFLQRPANHLLGQGCVVCAGRAKSDTEDFIRKALLIHGDKYDYSKVDYITALRVVDIICKEYQFTFKQTPNNHLRNHGCIHCSGTAQSDTDDFIRKATLKHEDRYDYSQVDYVNCKTKVKIICQSNDHGAFVQAPSDHLSGQGCFRCLSKGYSDVQIQWLEFVEKYEGIEIQHFGNSSEEHKIKSTNWRADGYCEATHTVYEFNGSYWHGDPKMYTSDVINTASKYTMGELYAKTIAREAIIKELGYNLVVMWQSDWKRMNRGIKAFQRKFKRSRSSTSKRKRVE